MSEAWSWAVRRYGDKRLFASRDILGEEDEIQPNGKLFRKLGKNTYSVLLLNICLLGHWLKTFCLFSPELFYSATSNLTPSSIRLKVNLEDQRNSIFEVFHFVDLRTAQPI